MQGCVRLVQYTTSLLLLVWCYCAGSKGAQRAETSEHIAASRHSERWENDALGAGSWGTEENPRRRSAETHDRDTGAAGTVLETTPDG